MKLPVGMFISGTVVRVRFPFKEGNGEKERPAIVMNYDESFTTVVLLQVTSHSPRTIYDYPAQDYDGTGFTRNPSVIRCNCVYTVPNSDLVEKMGNLSRRDYNIVSILYQQAISNCNIENYN